MGSRDIEKTKFEKKYFLWDMLYILVKGSVKFDKCNNKTWKAEQTGAYKITFCDIFEDYVDLI